VELEYDEFVKEVAKTFRINNDSNRTPRDIRPH